MQVQLQIPPSKQHQSLPQHSSTHQQFQINKAYNVVSILKSSPRLVNSQPVSHLAHSHHQVHVQHSQNQAQHRSNSTQQQQKSFLNVVNGQTLAPGGIHRSPQQQKHTVICSGGNIMTVNELYNLSGHRSSTGIIDSYRVSDVSKVNNTVANQQQQQEMSDDGSCNDSNHSGSIITLGNSNGITLGTSSGASFAIHDKSLLHVNVNVGVGVNVNCFDSRKYDYKNNNLLTNSSFQAPQEVGEKIEVKSN